MPIPNPDFRKLFEAAPGLFVVLLPDFTIAAVSDDYVQTAKTIREKILGRNFFEVFPGDPSDKTVMENLKKSLEKVIATRKSDIMVAQKYHISRPESEGGGYDIKYWTSVNTPILSSNGEVQSIIRRVEDVTTLVHQENERKALEQEHNLFFKNSFDLLAIVGTDGYFKRVNPSFERVMGYKEEELYTKPVVEFLHPDDVAKTKKGIQTLTSGVPTIASKNRYLCKDGSYRWFSWNTVPLDSLFYTVGRDITDQIVSDERISQLNSELEKKNIDLEEKINERIKDLRQSEAQVLQLQKMDAVGRLAGGIAHDFNNMLGAITLYSDLLMEKPDEPEYVQKNAKEITAVTKRAAALTKQLLIFSRKQIIQLQTVNLNPLIQQLENMLMRLIEKNISIKTKLAKDLKPVNINPSQMEQVILNLVVNAKDAFPTTITLETSNVYLDETFTSTHLTVSPGHHVLLTVTDDGVGMDSATLSRIFEPFFTTKPAGKGTGLGLTTTYGIVKQNKGNIWVYSEVGRGTVFKIYLPVAEQIMEEVEIAPTKLLTAETGTILLVEDDDVLRIGFSTVLEDKGYKVLLAKDGNEALTLCTNYQNQIHLLLTDVVMPGMSGFELSKKILATKPNLKVLYMSGYTNDTLDKSGVENHNELDFIQKPFGTNALITKVQEVLSRS